MSWKGDQLTTVPVILSIAMENGQWTGCEVDYGFSNKQKETENAIWGL